jgi:hypothetical protein
VKDGSGEKMRKGERSESVREGTTRRLCGGIWRIRRPKGARGVGVDLEGRLLRGEREGVSGGVSREATPRMILPLLQTLVVRARRVTPARRKRNGGMLPFRRQSEE